MSPAGPGSTPSTAVTSATSTSANRISFANDWRRSLGVGLGWPVGEAAAIMSSSRLAMGSSGMVAPVTMAAVHSGTSTKD